MSFLCRAKTTMSSYVMNFEELLFQGLSANEMTQPLSAIICVAIFSVNFPLQEKSCIYCNSQTIDKGRVSERGSTAIAV